MEQNNTQKAIETLAQNGIILDAEKVYAAFDCKTPYVFETKIPSRLLSDLVTKSN